MGIFNLPWLDALLEGSRRKRLLLLTNDLSQSLFLIQQFLSQEGVFIKTKPIEISAKEVIDWYSARSGFNEGMPSDAVQFFATLKKIPTRRIAFHFTPAMLFYAQEASALLENLSAYCAEKDITLLVIIEPLEILKPTLAEIKNFFDFVIAFEGDKITITSIKMAKEDLVIPFAAKEFGVVLRTQNGIEECNVSYCSKKRLLWLPGSELLFPSAVNEAPAIYFSVDARTKDYLIEQCLSDSLFSSNPIIFVSSQTSFQEFKEKIRARKGLSLEQKNFLFIDYFSWNSRRVIELEQRANEILVSKDIVYLSVAMEWALKRYQGSGIIIFDAISALIQNYSIEEVCSFLAVQIARAKRRGFELMSFGMLDVVGYQNAQAMASIHDGHVVITSNEAFVASSDTFYHASGKFGVAFAAGVLSIIAKQKKEEELSDEEIARVLRKLDELLGELPDEKVLEFAQSEEFKLYDRLLRKYGI